MKTTVLQTPYATAKPAVDVKRLMILIDRYSADTWQPLMSQLASSTSVCMMTLEMLVNHLTAKHLWLFADHTIKFSFQTMQDTLIIDASAARHLELVESASSSSSSLYHVLNHTHTTMGARLLRSTILRPTTNHELLKLRLDAVHVLLHDANRLGDIVDALKPLKQLPMVLASLVKVPSLTSTENYINNVIIIKEALLAIKDLHLALLPYEDTLLFNDLAETLKNDKIDEFRDVIDQTINEDVRIDKTALGIRNQRCYAIKSGVNELLDVARQTYKETIQSIYDLTTEYCQNSSLPIKLQFGKDLNFYLTCPVDKAKMDEMPDIFINRVKKKKTLTFTTMDLLKMNEHIDQCQSDIFLMSDKTIHDLLETFRLELPLLRRITDAIAHVDLVTSFAIYATKHESVRPRFLPRLVFKAGRHPILDALPSTNVVPNDTQASLATSLQFITGANMAGKTTYLKQIALLTIMAHTGSYVPAMYASMPPITQILTQLTNDTDPDASSFANETKRISNVLKHVTHTSLVLIDEYGRGTSPSDAIGLATAICEKLVQTHAFVFFVTHFHNMVSHLSILPNVATLQLSHPTRDSDADHDHAFKITSGLTRDTDYGIMLAADMGMPDMLINHAKTVRSLLAATHAAERDNLDEERDQTNHAQLLADRKILLQFADKMMMLRSTCTPDIYEECLGEIQREFREVLASQATLDLVNASSMSPQR
ncbi:muts domain V-domain-containing protein [Gongronella butleri]|nr:muts domain V-domain-containing protein [Gongronella butleri]